MISRANTNTTTSAARAGAGRGFRRRQAGRTLRPAALLAAGVLGLALSGCASTRSIGELMDDPFRFDGREVTVQGEVRESLGLLGPGYYRLEDASGSLPVVSGKGGAPRSGAEMRVTGTFRAAFTVAGRTLAVLVEQKRETP